MDLSLFSGKKVENISKFCTPKYFYPACKALNFTVNKYLCNSYDYHTIFFKDYKAKKNRKAVFKKVSWLTGAMVIILAAFH